MTKTLNIENKSSAYEYLNIDLRIHINNINT